MDFEEKPICEPLKLYTYDELRNLHDANTDVPIPNEPQINYVSYLLSQKLSIPKEFTYSLIRYIPCSNSENSSIDEIRDKLKPPSEIKPDYYNTKAIFAYDTHIGEWYISLDDAKNVIDLRPRVFSEPRGVRDYLQPSVFDRFRFGFKTLN